GRGSAIDHHGRSLPGAGAPPAVDPNGPARENEDPVPDSSSTPPVPSSNSSDLALVLAGGGARAAHQVGFLRAVAKARPDLQIPILTGVSAGALNAAYLVAHPGRFVDAVEGLAEIWRHLDATSVFRTDAWSLGRNVGRWALRL